jgi:hypothetical protein
MTARRWGHGSSLKQQYAWIHDCNLYCRPEDGVHCHTFYANPDADPDEIRRLLAGAVEQHYAAEYIASRPAPELPPQTDPEALVFTERRPGSTDVAVTDGPAANAGWLVWARGGTILTREDRERWEQASPEERRAMIVPGAGNAPA